MWTRLQKTDEFKVGGLSFIFACYEGFLRVVVTHNGEVLYDRGIYDRDRHDNRIWNIQHKHSHMHLSDKDWTIFTDFVATVHALDESKVNLRKYGQFAKADLVVDYIEEGAA